MIKKRHCIVKNERLGDILLEKEVKIVLKEEQYEKVKNIYDWHKKHVQVNYYYDNGCCQMKNGGYYYSSKRN